MPEKEKVLQATEGSQEILASQLNALTSQLQATGNLMQALGQQLETLANTSAPERRRSFWDNFKDAGTPSKALPASRLDETLARNVELAEKLKSKDQELEKLNKLQAGHAAQLAALQTANSDLKKQLAEKTAENRAFQKECANLGAKFREQWDETARTITSLENAQTELTALKAEFEHCQNELAHKQSEFDNINDTLQKYQTEYVRIQAEKFRPLADALEHIPAGFRPLVQSYYEIDNLPEFLTQCGQFNRLSQLWQSCRSNIVNGENLAGMEVFLLRVLEIYNNAFPENAGREIIPQLDTWYDYNTQERMGGNGTRVASVILPGLVQPNGQVGVKALVKLD